MPEQARAEPSAPEQARAEPSARQRFLPIEVVEQSDQAYLAAVEECGLPKGVAAICRWLIQDGRREAGTKRLPVRTQRQLAKRLGISASTVCAALERLQISGLVTQADGDYRLNLSLLVSVSEEAMARRAKDPVTADPGAALDCLLAQPRSACSGALGLLGPPSVSVSVKEKSLYPVSVSESVSVSRGSGGIPTAAERSERDDCLKFHQAWQALQTRHFRPMLDCRALQPCFYAAVEADLLDNTDEHKIRFLATAWDLARNQTVGKPAVCLRKRVERGACFRISPEGAEWAKSIVRPGSQYGSQRRKTPQENEYE